MYRNYETYSFLRLLLPLIAGIVCYLWLSIVIPFAKVLLLLCFLILFAIAVIGRLNKSSYGSLLFGISLNMLLFFAGNHLSYNYDLSNKQNFFSNYIDNSDYTKLQIEAPFVLKGNYYKSTASIIASYKNETANAATGKTYINIKKDDVLIPPNYGDILLAKNKLFEIDGPKNIGEFSYQQYSNLKQIHFQTYLNRADYSIVCENCGSQLWTGIYQLRVQLINALIYNIKDETSLAITSALLLGQKNFLTKKVKSTFADTGAMHILAVSGLHVGILFLLLNLLFKPIANGRWGRAVAAILSVLVIWLYAGITGFSASVTRASLMFSFFLIAEIIARDKNTYNVLAASAFFILLYRPNMLAEVGFQLSYAAVFSIVTLHPYIYKWFTFKSKIVNFFWSISAVSIAAQIGTVPISLYYFHQFPTTFLLSNLVAIPAATAIFIGGISILSFSFIVPTIAALIGKLLEMVIGTLHFALSAFNKLPFSTIEFNSFANYVVFLMFLFFIGLLTWLVHQNRRALWLGAFSLLLLCGSNAFKKIDTFNHEKLMVYSNNKGLNIETFTSGKVLGSIATADFANNLFAINKPVHQFFQISEQFDYQYPNIKNIYQFKSKVVLLLNDELVIGELPKGIKVDVLIIENNPYINNVEKLVSEFGIKEVVITSNNNYTDFYMKKFSEHNVQCYSIKEEGMYLTTL